MAEHRAFEERWRAGAPHVVGRVTLLPIERITRHGHRGEAGLWVAVDWGPWALVIRDAAGLRAVDLAGAALPLAQVRAKVPDLDRALASA
jgi:hypothetical protein